MVLVTVPNDGGHPSASLGFVGMYGPLAGMSSQGLTVHEANLEVDKNSLNGFPWALRLRYEQFIYTIYYITYIARCASSECLVPVGTLWSLPVTFSLLVSSGNQPITPSDSII